MRPAKFFEEVVLTYDGDECLLWPYGKMGDGYGAIQRNRRRHYVHRLVCELEHGPAPTPKHEAAHSCGNVACANWRHLSWKTRKENEADKISHGTVAKGERNGRAKLTEDEVRQIISLEGTMYQWQIADKFGVGQPTINNILRRRNWTQVTTEN